jgi:toxin FitB
VAFDDAAAAEYAALVVSRERAGKPISRANAPIAAICSCGMHTLATRNVDDFGHIDIVVINPWEA